MSERCERSIGVSHEKLSETRFSLAPLSPPKLAAEGLRCSRAGRREIALPKLSAMFKLTLCMFAVYF